MFSSNSSVFYFHFPELRSSACGNPGVPPKGILNGTQFNVGDKIRYRCVAGYVLDGHSLLTCVTNAAGVSVWDFPVPICRGEGFLVLKWVTYHFNCKWWLLPSKISFFPPSCTMSLNWIMDNTWCYLHILGLPKTSKRSRWLVCHLLSFEFWELLKVNCFSVIDRSMAAWLACATDAVK